MDFLQSLSLYLLLGLGVAIAYAARGYSTGPAGLTLAAVWLFWPLFVPSLLGGDPTEPPHALNDLTTDVERGMAQLDRIATPLPPSVSQDWPAKLQQLKSEWTARLAWLRETNELIATLGIDEGATAMRTGLQEQQAATRQSLKRSLNSGRDLVVAVQMLKAPGTRTPAELEQFDRAMQAALELENTSASTGVLPSAESSTIPQVIPNEP